MRQLPPASVLPYSRDSYRGSIGLTRQYDEPDAGGHAIRPNAVTIVTGAGSGLGRELARSLVISGGGVTLVGRRKDCLDETRDRCMAAGAQADQCLVVEADVTESWAADEIAARTVGSFGHIDALVNNAAITNFGPIGTAQPDDLEQVMRTNLIAPLLLIQKCLPALREAKGTIVNVGSIGGLLALPSRSAYGASKAALHHLTRSLARELAPRVRVNAVLPGALDTEVYDHLGLPAGAVSSLREEMVRTTPLGRMGMPTDVVPWIELLLRPAGRWMTGSLIVVDGGRSC
jgi:NAD(P)-dependent dehydrogenase (short-subunit alcohol dehydrogenase family)